MGSFNTTCVISQQVIKPEDEVYIMPIKQSSSYDTVELQYENYKGEVKTQQQYSYSNSNCYATAFWDNAGPLFTGTYNDYGCFKLTENTTNSRNLITLFNDLHTNSAKVLEGENRTHDIEFDLKSLYSPEEKYSFEQLHSVWDSVWQAMYKGRIFVKNNEEGFRPFSFSVAHKVAVDYFVNQYKDLPGLVIKDLNKNYERVKKYCHDMTIVENTKPEKIEMFEEMSKWTFEDVLSLESLNFAQGSHRNIKYLYPPSIETLKEVKHVFREYYKNNPEATEVNESVFKALYEHMQPILVHKIVLGGMEGLDIKLSPIPYASQDYSNDTGNYYTKMVKEVNKVIKEQIKQKDKNNGYDDDDKPARKNKLK